MPVSPTYPGVYIEEIPSGVRTIMGVATAITAFVGRTLRGPTNDPTEITSFADFERRFGGLQAEYPLSYAVRDFYRNGGERALIVRLFKAPDSGDGRSRLEINGLKLTAADPGLWGDQLYVWVERPDADTATALAKRYPGVDPASFFDLVVAEGKDDRNRLLERERFRNVTVVEGPRRIDRVLAKESGLVRITSTGDQPDLPAAPPEAVAKEQAAQAKDGVDSAPLAVIDYQQAKDAAGNSIPKTGLYALDKADLFNLLCIPPDTRDGDTPKEVYQEAMAYCARKRAMLIVDPPRAWGARPETAPSNAKQGLTDLGLSGLDARNAALYFPLVKQADPLRENQIELFAPCGIIAGLYAKTDTQRGVWKAPAGIDAALSGVAGLQVNLNDLENGTLNPLGINCLRLFPAYGCVVWGARTLRGNDQMADEYKYVPIRRLALFIEETLYRGTQWVVFEPNDEPLWSQIRLNIGAFMHTLFRQGAFQGTSPRDAYFVKCDATTTTQNDRDRGIVNIVVGFAPLKPAEFVIIKIQQIAGKIEV